MEATGGYERQPFGQLWAAGLPAAIVTPCSVRSFAKAMGVLEKTDHIDCGIVAWYGQTKCIKPMPPASATQQRLAALVVRLRQLTELKVEQTNQRRLVTEPDALASFEPIMAATKAMLRSLEAKIAEAIAADPMWVALDRAFRSIKGVAGRTVARLMAEMPEIVPCPTKPSPSSPGWRRSPTIVASISDDGLCVVAAKASARSCSWLRRSFGATSRTSTPFTRSCRRLANPRSS